MYFKELQEGDRFTIKGEEGTWIKIKYELDVGNDMPKRLLYNCRNQETNEVDALNPYFEVSKT